MKNIQPIDLQEIHDMWKVDCVIVNNETLADVASQQPLLHAKYCKIYGIEQAYLRRLEMALKQLRFKARQFYATGASKDDTHGWTKPLTTILKNEIEEHVNTNPDVISATLEYGDQSEKVDLLKSILNEINNRQWIVGKMNDANKFYNGIN